MRKLIVMIMMFAVAITANAQSDFEVAQSFMQKKGITLQDNPKTSINRAASNKPYSIYNGEEGKGFAIVVNGSIVGYSTENSVDINDICPTLEVILKEYAAMSNNRTESTSDLPSWFEPRNVTPIEPLLKTEWHQGTPYNNILNQTGICVVVSLAQMLHYFKSQMECEVVDSVYDYDEFKYVPSGIVLPNITFNHDLILDKYEPNKYTEEQGEEVAKLYNYAYYSGKSGYKFNNTWGYESYTLQIWEFDDRYILIDPCLDRKIPVQSFSWNHAYVVDGRDSQGLYHINLGWGGGGNGYYAVPRDQSRNGLNHDGSGASHAEDMGCFKYLAPRNWDEIVAKIDSNTQNKAHTSHFYNLNGQYVGETLKGLPRGIYVSNGKKYIVK